MVHAPDVESRLHLAWQVEIYQHDAQHFWLAHVSAQTGDLIYLNDQVVHDRWVYADEEVTDRQTGKSPAPTLDDPGTEAVTAAGSKHFAEDQFVLDGSSYRVYAMPYGSPEARGRELVVEPALEEASPYGWHDTDGSEGPEYTITRGNNVHAYQDRNDSDFSSGDEPDGGSGLVFDFGVDLTRPPKDYVDAAVVNLFYWSNLIHDLSYVRGFDEPAGNFQVNNYGNGGQGGDAVLAEAQDGADKGKSDNANFWTPPDGQSPRMQMFEWTYTNPRRDGDLDAAVILHEYGHGISIRQTGGPSVTYCLNNPEQGGEGWSDWQGLIYTAQVEHDGPTRRGMATYSVGEPAEGGGIRAYPYSTDMSIDPRTYQDTRLAAVPHGVGSIWAAILWEVYWGLVDEYGFNEDFYAPWDEGGNLLAMQLVNDGLKLQPCSPGFVDSRDAILAADQALTDGANQCLLWEAFAKRGLGFSANQGSSSTNSDNTEAFDVPVSCDTFDSEPLMQQACVGDDVAFDLDLGNAWSGPTDLSVKNAPGHAQFSPNPVNAPGSSILNIVDTETSPAGSYILEVTGNDGSFSASVELGLELLDATPGQADLLEPHDGMSGLDRRPELTWAEVPGASGYKVEISDTYDFSQITESVETEATSWWPSSVLEPHKAYYWRVQALNICGGGMNSEIRQFRTREHSLACGTTINFETGIPHDWDVVDNESDGNGLVWRTTADAECGWQNETGGAGEAACADAEKADRSSFDTAMVVPSLNLNNTVSATLDVSTYFRFRNMSELDIDIDDGSGWQTLWGTMNTGAKTEALNLDPWVGRDDVRLRFRYHGQNDNFNARAQVDDVSLTCDSTQPPSVLADRGVISATVFSGDSDNRQLVLHNEGDMPLQWQLTYGDSCSESAPSWLESDLGAGTIQSGKTASISLELDASDLRAGQKISQLCVESNDPQWPSLVIPVFMDVVEDEIFRDCFDTDKTACTGLQP